MKLYIERGFESDTWRQQFNIFKVTIVPDGAYQSRGDVLARNYILNSNKS